MRKESLEREFHSNALSKIDRNGSHIDSSNSENSVTITESDKEEGNQSNPEVHIFRMITVIRIIVAI